MEETKKWCAPFITELRLTHFRSFYDTMTVPKIKSSLAIMGVNGTGKTSVLWGFVLLFRAFNARTKPTLVLLGRELMEQLNYCTLESCHLGETALHTKCTAGTLGRMEGQILGHLFSCSFNGNGTITPLNSSPPYAPDEAARIRYAFMGIEPIWVWPSNEGDVNHICTSHRPNLRKRYTGLSKESKAAILGHIQDLFPLLKITCIPDRNDKGMVKVGSADGVEVEIMFTGAAFRKVFAVFVLLYTLVELTNVPRVYLIEEPEVLLYPTVLRKLFTMLSLITGQHNIQLIVTTNSEYALELFAPNEVFVLMTPATTPQGYRLCKKEWLKDAIDKHLLDIPPEVKSSNQTSLIWCEDINDPHFLKVLAPLYDISFDGIEIWPSSAQNDKSGLQDVIKSLNSHVWFLRDPHFKTVPKPRDREIFWRLPSIESYLFLYYCVKHKNDATSPLAFLQSPIKEKFFKKYAYGFLVQNASAPSSDTMIQRWQSATTAASHVPPSEEDIMTAILVVHGHTWVQHVKPYGCHDTTTLVNYVSTTGDFATCCPGLGEEMRVLLTHPGARSSHK